MADVRGLRCQEDARPAGNLEQVVVWLEIELSGHHRIDRCMEHGHGPVAADPAKGAARDASPRPRQLREPRGPGCAPQPWSSEDQPCHDGSERCPSHQPSHGTTSRARTARRFRQWPRRVPEATSGPRVTRPTCGTNVAMRCRGWLEASVMSWSETSPEGPDPASGDALDDRSALRGLPGATNSCISGFGRAVATRPIGPRPPAQAAAAPGTTRAGPWSPHRPWTGRWPGGASRSSATGPGGGRPPSPNLLRRQQRPPRARGPWRARLVGTAGASCAPDQLARLWRLGEPHRDRKVVGGGAIPLAPTELTFFHADDAGSEGRVPASRRGRPGEARDGRARTRQVVGGTDLPGNSSLNCFAYWRLPTRRQSTLTERGMPA